MVETSFEPGMKKRMQDGWWKWWTGGDEMRAKCHHIFRHLLGIINYYRLVRNFHITCVAILKYEEMYNDPINIIQLQPATVRWGFHALTSATSLWSCETVLCNCITAVVSWRSTSSVPLQLVTSLSFWMTSYVVCDDVSWMLKVMTHRPSSSSATGMVLQDNKTYNSPLT